MVDELKQTGIDHIILLTHYGYQNELELATKIDGVDVIIGGDSHTLLGDFDALGLNASVHTRQWCAALVVILCVLLLPGNIVKSSASSTSHSMTKVRSSHAVAFRM